MNGIFSNRLALDHILFIDVETVAQFSSYDKMDERSQELWGKKASLIRTTDQENSPESLYDRAGIYSEFGKIICISTGFLQQENGELRLRIKSFYGDEEEAVLKSFAELLSHKKFSHEESRICGHNIREFDVPYIARRMVIKGIELPEKLKIAGKKPWDVNHLDTMELWKFGDYKSYTSLDLLSHILGIPSPKSDMDGSMVNKVYHEENNLERIKNYCEMDVITTANILLKMAGLDILGEWQVVRN